MKKVNWHYRKKRENTMTVGKEKRKRKKVNWHYRKKERERKW